jgi:hypothetical protein
MRELAVEQENRRKEEIEWDRKKEGWGEKC